MSLISKIKKHSFTQRAIKIFSQGLNPRDLAMTIALGILIGLLPIFGIQTPLITFLALALRLNVPIAVFVLYLMTPINILAFIPLVRIGEWIIGASHRFSTFEEFKFAFFNDGIAFYGDLIGQVGYGLLGWVLTAIPFAILVFLILWQVIKLVNNYRITSK